MLTDDKVLQTVKQQLKKTRSTIGEQYKNTDKCYAFYDAEDSSYKDSIQFTDTVGNKKRAEVVFNEIKSSIDMVAGFFSQNRRQAKFIARLETSPIADLYSRYMNGIYSYHRDNTNADQLESMQDKEVLIAGYSAIETDLSYVVGQSTTNPYGEITKLKLNPKCVGWDTRAEQVNLLDSRWAYYHFDMDLQDALNLFIGSKSEQFGQAEGESTLEGGYNYNPFGGVYDKIKEMDSVEWADKENDRVRIYNHQWFEYEKFYRAQNPVFLAQTPQDALFARAKLEVIAENTKIKTADNINYDDAFKLDPNSEELVFDDETRKALQKEFGDLIQPIAFVRKAYYTAVYSGSHIFSWFRSISQQGFSIKFKTGIYNHTKKIWTGMVNPMIDPQKYRNKSLTELMFIIGANSKGGVMVEEDAVENIADFEANYARTDAVIKVRAGALAQGKIQPKASPAIPSGLENIIMLSEASINKNGVDPALGGALDKQDQSGILYKRRIRQIISKFANYFDSIMLYQKEDARLCADLIRVWVQNNAGQFVRITGEDGADEFVRLSEDNLAAEYDISIQEGMQTEEDKRETGQLLGTIADKFMAVGDINSAKALILESLPFIGINGDVRKRITESMGAGQQDSVPLAQFQELQAQLEQLQSQQTQLLLAEMQARIDKTKADTGKVAAETAKALESAANQGLENDLLRQGNYTNVNVSI